MVTEAPPLLSPNDTAVLPADRRAHRVVIAYRTDAVARHLLNCLDPTGAFDVRAILGVVEDLAGAIRDNPPDALIVENGALTSENLQAVLDTAVARPGMAVLGISPDAVQRDLTQIVTVVCRGHEAVVDAIRRRMEASADISGATPVAA